MPVPVPVPVQPPHGSASRTTLAICSAVHCVCASMRIRVMYSSADWTSSEMVGSGLDGSGSSSSQKDSGSIVRLHEVIRGPVVVVRPHHTCAQRSLAKDPPSPYLRGRVIWLPSL